MYDTKDTKTRSLFGSPEARKAQDAYIGLFYEKMELTLHQSVFRFAIDVLDALGAAEQDQQGQDSVLDLVALELENWQAVYQEADKILARQWREHENNRQEKRRVKVRRYLTNEEFEDQLYHRPEHVNVVGTRVMGQVRGETGMVWQRVEETEPLDYRLVSAW